MENIDLSTILASTIHESENRIGTLLYQLQFLKDDAQDRNKNLKTVEKIEESLKQLNDEWVEYLYLYKLASKGYLLHPEPQKLDEFLDDQVFALSSAAQAKDLSLNFTCAPTLVADFDERLMTSVISTAIYNALRFANTKITLMARIQEDHLVFSIEDDGPGFPDEQQGERLFSNNIGLGLYFAELSAKAHEVNGLQGHIEKGTSKSLGGACLKVFIPQ